MRGVLVLACLSASVVSASAAPFSVGTGVAAWQVMQTAGASNSGAALNTVTSAVVLTGTLPFLSNFPALGANAWVVPPAGSAWVGQLATDGVNSDSVAVSDQRNRAAVEGFGCYVTDDKAVRTT